MRPDRKAVIRKAMNTTRCLAFHYHGRRRVIEPHVLGRSRKGCDMVSGYLVDGLDLVGDAAPWRQFNLGEMRGLTVCERSFAGPRPGYDGDAPGITAVYARL